MVRDTRLANRRGTIPIGTIVPVYEFDGPTGPLSWDSKTWALCDGSVIADTDSPLVGLTLPDLSGRCVIGAGTDNSTNETNLAATLVQAAGGAGGIADNGPTGGAGNAGGWGGGGAGAARQNNAGGAGSTNGGGGGGGRNSGYNGGNGDIGGGGGAGSAGSGGNASGALGGIAGAGTTAGGTGADAYGNYGLSATGGGGGGSRGSWAQNGGSGGTSFFEHHFETSGGGGGGGGPGYHGKNICLRIGGTFNGSGGTVDVSGGVGGTGGRGGTGDNHGAGGGGGAGGAGGNIVIHHSGLYTAATYVYNGGTGGAGGAAGGSGATTGSNGAAGASGTLDVSIQSCRLTGADGALSIPSGNVNLPAGSVKDYSSINIAPGATLTITGNSADFTIIGCLGNFTLGGSIICKDNTTVGSTTYDFGSLNQPDTDGNGDMGTDVFDHTNNLVGCTYDFAHSHTHDHTHDISSHLHSLNGHVHSMNHSHTVGATGDAGFPNVWYNTHRHTFTDSIHHFHRFMVRSGSYMATWNVSNLLYAWSIANWASTPAPTRWNAPGHYSSGNEQCDFDWWTAGKGYNGNSTWYTVYSWTSSTGAPYPELMAVEPYVGNTVGPSPSTTSAPVTPSITSVLLNLPYQSSPGIQTYNTGNNMVSADIRPRSVRVRYIMRIA